MPRLLIGLGSTALVIVVLLFALPFLIPASPVKDQLSRVIKDDTGRQLVIEGDGRFRLFPSAGVTFEQVRLSGPQDSPDLPFLSASAVTAEFDIWSLLTGVVRVDALTLDEAYIDLRLDADGRANWEFAEAQDRRPARVRPAAVHAGLAGAPHMQIRQIRLRDSTIRYHSHNLASPLQISDANLTLLQPDAASAATLSGFFRSRGRRIDVEASLNTPQHLNRGKPAEVQIALESAFAQLNFTGQVKRDRAYRLSGTLTADATALDEVFAVAGADTAPALQSATLTAKLDAQESNWKLTELEATFDDMAATGKLAMVQQSERSMLNGNLAFDRLDLDKFALRSISEERDSAAYPALGLWSAHAAAASEDITINLEALDSLNADIEVTADLLSRKALRAESARARIRLEAAVLSVKLSRLQLYNGDAVGSFELNAHEGIPVITAVVEFEGVDSLPLLTDASSFDWVSGKLNGQVKLASGGMNWEILRSRLRGEARMRVDDGALRGLDLPGMLGRLQSGELAEFDRREGDLTRFDSLEANWILREGVAKTSDIRLKGGLVNAEGRGKLNIVKETLDLRLTPTVTPRSADKEEGQSVAFPLHIKGKWKDPKIYPDVDEVLKDPKKSLGAAKSFGKAVEKLTGGEVSEDDFGRAIDDLFGSDKD